MEGLPPELWEKVIWFCSPTDQIALCRVSRYFQVLATQHVYRSIDLRSPLQTMRCCRSIVQRPSNATAVRAISLRPSWVFILLFILYVLSPDIDLHRRLSMHLIWCSSMRSKCLAGFVRTIMAALTACSSNLLHLTIGFHLDLSQCHFPLLQGFCIPRHIAFTPAICLFLQQHHSKLQILELKSDAIHPTASPIPVPQLCHFAGTNRTMNALTFGPSIRDLYIRWVDDFTAAGIENSLRAFSPSADSVQSFRSAHNKFHPQFLDTFYRIFPRITVLLLGFYASPTVSNPGLWMSHFPPS